MSTAPSGSAEAETCPICGAARWTRLYPARGYEIAACAACGVQRTLGVSDDGGLNYPPFDQTDAFVVRLLRKLVAQLLRERVAFLDRLGPPGERRLLDFGCGSGSFARAARDAGYDVVGVEPFSLGKPLDEPRLHLRRAPLDEVFASLGEFDVITLWQVLEHVRDPAALLARLLEKLRPDGTLVLSVPNIASWQARLFRADWFHLDPPRHITHFDARTLGGLCARLGLEVIAERHFHLEYGPVGWVQSALNRALPRPNVLYEFVKDRGALAEVPRAETWLSLLASFAGGALLSAPALLVELVASGAGAGAVLTVAARRQR